MCRRPPFAIAGGGGDVTTNVFEMAQRFDFVAFDRDGTTRTGGADRPVSLDTVGNTRSTPGLFGAGYIELLATGRRPSLVVRPWQHSGTSVSIREITNTLFNHHHGIQSVERFGADRDPDGDGARNELTVGDVTAAAIYQATLPVPGRVIPNDPDVERAILIGERAFDRIGCAACHLPSLPLDQKGWIYSEPGPFNPTGTQPRTASRVVEIDGGSIRTHAEIAVDLRSQISEFRLIADLRSKI